jgi:hypothetical protein
MVSPSVKLVELEGVTVLKSLAFNMARSVMIA